MSISHAMAIRIEHLVRGVWGLNGRGHLHGAIDADHFSATPYDAALYILAPYVLRNSEVDSDSKVHSLCEEIWEITYQDETSPEIEEELYEKLKELRTYLSENHVRAI